MPDRVSVVSGGELGLDPKNFQVSHPHIQPSAIIYRLIQVVCSSRFHSIHLCKNSKNSTCLTIIKIIKFNSSKKNLEFLRMSKRELWVKMHGGYVLML